MLSKADPTLSEDAKTALLTRQFSRGLPQSLKRKMLEHNPKHYRTASTTEPPETIGRKSGGDRAHPIVSTNVMDKCPIIHPFVDCFVDEVRLHALVDSGSMKSFISQSVQRTVDFDDRKLNKSKKAKCVSIMGYNVTYLVLLNS
ncbi:Hypothetical predicted protein [Paramuricea clavata]|uniref:Uncharacterized protein n=1 Tax=Paramuricea clavata TaxID=317549 RepID=A0A6S7IZF4_PARCT|nr:Hypothetical predicted protein [Paramuricea clavata]